MKDREIEAKKKKDEEEKAKEAEQAKAEEASGMSQVAHVLDLLQLLHDTL